MYAAFLKDERQSALLKAGLMIAGIALVDWWVVGEIPLGFLYLAPMLIIGGVLTPWQIVAIAVVCTFLAEFFDDLAWNLRTGISRMCSTLRHLSGLGSSFAKCIATAGSLWSTFTK